MEQELGERLARYLKAELKRAGLTYDDLAERLSANGMAETKPSIANKLSRGTFSATFFIAVLMETGTPIVRLEDVRATV